VLEIICNVKGFRLFLSTVLTEGWTTRQVDYTNAFAQAELREEVFLEFPKMFGPKSKANVVLKLLKSLHGLRQAPRTFFEKLRDGLLERGYTQSANDPCLFMKEEIICEVYVDHTIFGGADGDVLEEEIRSLGVSDTEQCHTLQLWNEGEVGAFLGIQISKVGARMFSLVQTGLIAKVFALANMWDCNGVSTPTGPTPIGSDTDGPPFSESWKYRTVVDMLMFLLLTHVLIFHLLSIKRLDSRMLNDNHMTLLSNVSCGTALLTMEAEYVALSQSMRGLIPVRPILQEIMSIVFRASPIIVYHSHSKAFDNVKTGTMPSSIIEQSTVYEDNQACL
jgi:hypothetical protein